MEWTDGMEYQLTKIAKTHIMAVAKLHISAVSPLLTSTGLLCLASVFYPHSQAHAWNIQLMDEAMFWQCGCQMMCVLIGMSLKLATPNYGPAFG